MRFFNIIILLANLFVALLLASVSIAHRINPHTLWWFEFIALGYPYYLIANSVCFAYWIFSTKKKNALISLVAFILSFTAFIHTYSYGFLKRTSESEQKSIKIISYNVNAFNVEGWKNRSTIQKRIVEFIAQEQADIICFQEFHYDPQEAYNILDTLTKNYGYKHYYTQKIHARGRYFLGSIIFSKYPISNTGSLLYEKKGNISQWADVIIAPDTIRVYNNHLESYRLKPDNIEALELASSGQKIETENLKSTAKKLITAMRARGKQIHELAEHIHHCPHKTMVCGDFNSPPYSYTYYTLRKKINLNDAFLAAGKATGGTYNWQLPPIRIDYILTDASIHTRSFELKKLNTSDHYPIISECVIP